MSAPADDWPALLAEATRELRMPLNAVLGWVQILRSAEGGETQRRAALETIERNARLKAQLLDDKLRPLAAERSVLVERTLDPRVGAVAADPQRLEQVVRVLLLAALRATADRGVVEVVIESAPKGVGIRVGRAMALEGAASEEDARLARHAGFDRHLPKPVDAAQLVRHLVELLAV
jgi:signal transduction histidine kinase